MANNGTKKRKIRVGSKIIEGGKVYRVFKIKKVKSDGESDRIIFYKPYFKDDINRTVVCSIPESSLIDTHIRSPITKIEVDEVFIELSRRIRGENQIDVTKDKTDLILNDIDVTVQLIRRYWREKTVNTDGFSKTKRDFLERAVDIVAQEVAVVKNTSLENAVDKVFSALEG